MKASLTAAAELSTDQGLFSLGAKRNLGPGAKHWVQVIYPSSRLGLQLALSSQCPGQALGQWDTVQRCWTGTAGSRSELGAACSEQNLGNYGPCEAERRVCYRELLVPCCSKLHILNWCILSDWSCSSASPCGKAGVCLCKHLLLYGSNRDKIFIRTLSSFRLVGEVSAVIKGCPNHRNSTWSGSSQSTCLELETKAFFSFLCWTRVLNTDSHK